MKATDTTIFFTYEEKESKSTRKRHNRYLEVRFERRRLRVVWNHRLIFKEALPVVNLRLITREWPPGNEGDVLRELIRIAG